MVENFVLLGRFLSALFQISLGLPLLVMLQHGHASNMTQYELYIQSFLQYELYIQSFLTRMLQQE